MSSLDYFDKKPWGTATGNKGPKRLARFCALGVLLPALLLCIPLYMRFVALRPHSFFLSPSDMKLLNQEGKMSSVWCQGQEVKMNGSFNAYVLPKRPSLRLYQHHITMDREMILKDDIKEYWGFYLLKGSRVKLSVCARFDGASFIVVRGFKDAKKCSYLGELDSDEESEDKSMEFAFRQFPDERESTNFINDLVHGLQDVQTEAAFNRTVEHVQPPKIFAENVTIGGRSEEVIRDLEKNFSSLSHSSKQSMMKRLLQAMGQNPDSHEFLLSISPKFLPMKRKNVTERRMVENDGNDPENSTTRQDRKSPARLQVDGDDDYEDGGGGEVMDAVYDDYDVHKPEVDLYDLRQQGKFDQTFANDTSGEETRSSWSSSEEALAACEGVLFNVALDQNPNCSHRRQDHGVESITLEVQHSGFYYFIFANENEITDNFLRAKFDMNKTAFDVSNQLSNCTNVSACQLPLTFWSEESVILEVPELQARQKTSLQLNQWYIGGGGRGRPLPAGKADTKLFFLWSLS